MTYEGLEPIEEIRQLYPNLLAWPTPVIPGLARCDPDRQIEVRQVSQQFMGKD
jgi:hypothetical protein